MKSNASSRLRRDNPIPKHHVLVTGATGFIGARIVDTLLNDPAYAVFFSGRSQPKDASFKARGARFLQGDLLDAEFCNRSLQNISTVIHCAGLAGTWGDYQTYYLANVKATENLVTVAKSCGANRFINISSPSIYFDFKNQLDLVESYLPPKFSNAYAKTKWESEQVVQNAHGPNFYTVSLRPRAVIGRGDQNIFPRVIRMVETGRLVQVGKGENVVDFTTVGNLVDAVRLCMEAPEHAMGEVYNITNGEPVRFWHLVESALAKAGLPSTRTKLPYGLVMAAATLNELICRAVGVKREPVLLPISIGVLTFSMTLNIDKARKKLGYQPRLKTLDGVNEFIQAWDRSQAVTKQIL